MTSQEMVELARRQITASKLTLTTALANEAEAPQCPAPSSLQAVCQALGVLLDMQVIHIEFLQRVNGDAEELVRERRAMESGAMIRAAWHHGLDLAKLAIVAGAAYWFGSS